MKARAGGRTRLLNVEPSPARGEDWPARQAGRLEDRRPAARARPARGAALVQGPRPGPDRLVRGLGAGGLRHALAADRERADAAEAAAVRPLRLDGRRRSSRRSASCPTSGARRRSWRRRRPPPRTRSRSRAATAPSSIARCPWTGTAQPRPGRRVLRARGASSASPPTTTSTTLTRPTASCSGASGSTSTARCCSSSTSTAASPPGRTGSSASRRDATRSCTRARLSATTATAFLIRNSWGSRWGDRGNAVATPEWLAQGAKETYGVVF